MGACVCLVFFTFYVKITTVVLYLLLQEKIGELFGFAWPLFVDVSFGVQVELNSTQTIKSFGASLCICLAQNQKSTIWYN